VIDFKDLPAIFWISNAEWPPDDWNLCVAVRLNYIGYHLVETGDKINMVPITNHPFSLEKDAWFYSPNRKDSYPFLIEK
jgi:hypothetical protein